MHGVKHIESRRMIKDDYLCLPKNVYFVCVELCVIIISFIATL
jgi:hypothetical protein